MNDGVALLLERMKTHPEEFESNVIGKWSHIINSYKQYLDEEDCKALDKAINALMQQQFTEKVMEELVDPKKSDNWVDRVMAQKGITSATPTPSPYIDKLTVEHMKAHLEALQVKDRNELINRKSTTLFGKLFNYQ